MSPETSELKELADVGLRIAKADLQRTGGVRPFFIFRQASGELRQLDIPEDVSEIMNSGPAKDILFETLRRAVQKNGYTAVLMATECWMGKQTEKGRAMDQKEFVALSRERGFKTAVAKGLITRFEAAAIVVQTADIVLTITQPFERDDANRRITFSEAEVTECPQESFQGRTKMYGDLREENLS